MMQPSIDYSEMTQHLEQGKFADFLTLEGYEMLDLLDFEEMAEPICDGSSKDVNITPEIKSSKARRKSMENYILASTSSRKRRSSSLQQGIRYVEPSDDMRNIISNPNKLLQQDKPVVISPTAEGLPHDPLNRVYEASLLRLASSLKRSTFSRMRVLQTSM